ncbi:MAG: methyltransferase domain-containing protein [Caldilineaceae bacterium]
MAARRAYTMDLLNLQPGEHVLDIGFGPGYFAAELAERVGASGRVEGIDFSDSMLGVAQVTCTGKAQVNLQVGDAKQLPYPNQHFDAAIAVQVYDYIDDIPAALAELYRVLKPGGRAVIADIDWGTLIWQTQDEARGAKFKEVLYEHFAQPHMPRKLPTWLKATDFAVKKVESLVMLNTEVDPYVFGLSKIAGRFITGRHGITAEEVAAWEADLAQMNQDGTYFFSANQYLFVLEKA